MDMVSHESTTLVSLPFHFTSFKACFQGGKERSIINGGVLSLEGNFKLGLGRCLQNLRHKSTVVMQPVTDHFIQRFVCNTGSLAHILHKTTGLGIGRHHSCVGDHLVN